MEKEEKYLRAKKRVGEIKGFYTHLFTYLIVNALLFVIDLLTPGGSWFYWPLLGWGIGIIAHGLNVFGFAGFLGPEWEKKKLQEEMDKIDNK